MSERPDKPHSDHGHENPGISALYRRTVDLEPPARLDDAILADARRLAGRGRRNWFIPLSTAAVIVIGVGVLLRIGSQPELSPAPQVFPSERAVPRSAGPEMEEAGPSSPPAAAKEHRDTAGARLKAAPAPRPEPDRSAPAVQGFSTEPVPSAPLSEPSMEDSAPILKRRSVAPDISREKRLDGKPAQRAGEHEAPEPERWLEQIRRLLAAGDRQAAKENLEAFKRNYPNYPVPKELEPAQ